MLILRICCWSFPPCIRKWFLNLAFASL
jgi:hypothetical protein